MPVSRANENICLFSPYDIVSGSSYGSWTARWWKWALAGPKETNPVLDHEGRYASRGQIGPVWFLAGTFGENRCPIRFCKIPAGKHVLFPVINYEANLREDPYLKNGRDLISHVSSDMDDIVVRKATIDGREVPVYRVKSDPLVFEITLEDNNVRDLPAGATQIASDGYWVFLKSMSSGRHTIDFHGACAGGARNSAAIYQIEII